jgi:hypothetical protein
VDASAGFGGDTIKLGNGNNDKVFSGGNSSHITVGNGDDTLHLGTDDTVVVGKGHDTFAFDGPFQNTPGAIGSVTITGFDPSKDVIQLQQPFFNDLQINPDGHGNTIISFSGGEPDTIKLVGVHASDVHASDFQLI